MHARGSAQRPNLVRLYSNSAVRRQDSMEATQANAAPSDMRALDDDALCEQLDRRLLECLALHEKIGSTRAEMGPMLREGWLQIARAQFAVGRSGVSADSYHLGAPAVTKVRIAREGGRVVYGLDTQLFNAATDAAADTPPPQSTPAQRVSGKDKQQLRLLACTRLTVRHLDPVRWFGGAKPPPRELRAAQVEFQSALRLASRLATTQLAFHEACDECESLAAEKSRRSEK